MVKALILFVSLGALALGATHPVADELGMTDADFHFSMAMSGIVSGMFFNFILWKLLP